MAGQGLLPSVSPDYPIAIKVAIDGTNRKFKLPLNELNFPIFNNKMREILQIPANQILYIERYSDSSGSYVPVDSRNPPSYKQLYRAARAKLKLRLKATLLSTEAQAKAKPQETEISSTQKLEQLPAVPTTAPVSKPKTEATVPITRSESPKLPSLCQIFDDSVRERGSLPIEQAAEASTPTEQAPVQVDRVVPATPLPGLSPPCWQVCCNKCDKQVTNEHYHCSICHNGDYDLCESCVNAGAVCEGQGHWMIKRTLKDGVFVHSTTETIATKAKEPEKKVETTEAPMPGSFANENKTAVTEEPSERICNNCIRHLPKSMVVSCKDCRDFDLCSPCLVENKHGHHPAHTFTSNSAHKQAASALCNPGRNVRHYATCDACDQTIFGVRHKCVECPDFDFCGKCYSEKRSSHDHRFVPIYEPMEAPTIPAARHIGIYCDGPLCSSRSSQSYIHGVRYKCALCHDTDFCANCEAHPDNLHSKTHPLIKFKTMIKDVSIETVNTTPEGVTTLAGDRPIRRPAHRSSTATLPRYTPPGVSAPDGLPAYSPTPAPSAPTPTPMQPSSPANETPLAQPEVAGSELKAEFVTDSVADGSFRGSGQKFVQTWVLRNPGPHPWPVGCSVRHVGGDYMLNVDQSRPGSVADLAKAQESNALTAPVLPGATSSFSVLMKAPLKCGKHISYWRLKSPDGTPFGHKLWCDIQVMASNPHNATSWRGPMFDYEAQMRLLEQQNKRQLLKGWKGMPSKQQAVPAKPDVNKLVATKGVKAQPASEGQRSTESTESTMVFPQLEKESPASSTHQDMVKSAGNTEALVSPSAATATTHETESAAGDVVARDEFDSDSDDNEDGFLTDEEYDILDASDEEVVSHGAF